MRARARNSSANSAHALEILLADDRGDPPSHHSTGSLNGVIPATVAAVRGASSWNEIEITCRGPEVHVAVNGEEVCHGDLTSSAALSGLTGPGRIELVDCGYPTDFRDIRVRLLDQDD